jgi:hypothetical protein
VNGVLTAKKRSFKLSECHVTADARRPDSWLLLELGTKARHRKNFGSFLLLFFSPFRFSISFLLFSFLRSFV